MPKRPARKGFARYDGGLRGWRNKVGMTFRPGKSVFVLAAHGLWAGILPGKIPARFYRSFHYPGDRLGLYRMDAEYTWCLNYPMLEALGPDVMSMVPEVILAAMRANHRLVVETNWAVSDEFETVCGDVHITRLQMADGAVTSSLPADDADASVHCGTLLLALTKAGNLRQRMKADTTWHNCPVKKGFLLLQTRPTP
jgi:hypothetical protein